MREKAAKYKDRFTSDRFTEIRKKAEGKGDVVVTSLEEEVEEEEGRQELIGGLTEEIGDEVGRLIEAPAAAATYAAAAAEASQPTQRAEIVDNFPKTVLPLSRMSVNDEVAKSNPDVGLEAAISKDDLSLHLGNDEDEDDRRDGQGGRPLSTPSSASSVTQRNQVTSAKIILFSLIAPVFSIQGLQIKSNQIKLFCLSKAKGLSAQSHLVRHLRPNINVSTLTARGSLGRLSVGTFL